MGILIEMSSYQFRRGQHVTVEIDGEQMDGVFVRQAERHDGIDPEEVPGGDISIVGWVQRSDTSEIEGFLYADIKPKPDAGVRIAIGKAYEAMQDERRTATEAFAEDLRATLGVSVDLEITEYQPGRRDLGPDRVDGNFHPHHRCDQPHNQPDQRSLREGQAVAPRPES